MRRMTLLLMLLSLGFAHALKAQITDVYVGNDTIELRVGNYQYGFVQWQTALDTANWTDIEGAIDTVYRFLPTRNGYYRARATFPNCPEEYSAVCYVQVPPVADAGPDRNLTEGFGATMFARLDDGCVGEWEILEGEHGVLSDLHSKNAYFEGTEGEYKLKWTVTNACGSASDTLTIKYYPTVMNENYLVVDTTDFILSDSTQLLNGEYIIAFSEPVTLNDSMLLMGMRDDSFLRRVVSYTYDEVNNVYDIMTEQGTIADLLIDGVFSFDLSSAFTSKKVVVTDQYPTRKEIAERGWDRIYIIQRDSEEDCLRWNFDIGQPQLSWTPGNFKLPYDFEIIPLFSMEKPNFMFEFEKHGFHVDSFKFGLYNTAYNVSAQIFVPGKVSFSVKEKLPILPKPIKFPSFLLFGVKLTPELSCDLNLSLQYSLGPEMYFYLGQTGYVSSYIIFDDETGWDGDSGISRHYNFDADWPDYGDLTGKASIDLKLSILGYDILGPYAGFSLAFEGTHNTFGSGFTAEQYKLKEEYKLGAKMKVFGWNIFDVDWPFVTFDMLNFQNPYSIQYVSGNNQPYTPGQQLSTPLRVRVKKSNDKPSKGVMVKYETGGSSQTVLTDDQGFASVYWTPGANVTGEIECRASSFNVKNEPVQGAPVVFKAHPTGSGPGGGGGGGWGGGIDCSSLSVTAYINGNNGLLFPRASGGHPPYMFSKDGVSYGSSVYYVPVQGQTYRFYVKDNEGCISDCSYTHPTQDCSNSTLDLWLSHQGSTVTAHATGGQIPYQYSLDSGPYGSAYVFSNLTNGEHVVNVRDANGCIDVAAITLDAYGGGGTNNGSVTVTTSPSVYVVDATSAHGGGSVSITGNATVSSYGLCWSRHHGPTTEDDYVQHAYNGNSFSGYLMVNLEPNKMYYLRAFAVTNKGTVYGNEVGFSTTAVPPVVTCGGVGNLTTTTAHALGNVSNINGTTVTERGFCWSTRHNPTINDDKLPCGFGTGFYSGDLTGLTPDTQYYLRAYATNSEGTGYSEEVSFETFGSMSFFISAVAAPAEGGTVCGGGLLEEGTVCMLTASANEGYSFVFWSDDGTMVSTNETYSFMVTGNKTLVANFAVSTGDAPVGAINGLYSIAPGYQIYFSHGNLQYIGHADAPYWKFADHQWDYFGDNGQGSSSSYVDRDLFGWGTSGYDHGAVCYQPWSASTYYGDYYAYGSSTAHLFEQTGQADWGYNAIANGGNTINSWRTLTNTEWSFLLCTRNTSSGIRFAFGTVNGVEGIIILPDDWDASNYVLNNTNTVHDGCSYENNVISFADWMNIFEVNGAAFLPSAGARNGWSVSTENYGSYWSSRCFIYNGGNYTPISAEGVSFSPSDPPLGYAPAVMIDSGFGRFIGFSVRLVHEGQGSAPIGYSPWQVGFVFTENITSESVDFFGDVNWGSCPIIEKGACWSISPHPTIADNYVEGNMAGQDIWGSIHGLTPNTTYYLRAFVTDSLLVYYSEDVVFTTLSGSGGHEYVDLGLPSGTLWATCNVGANAPEEYGDYFAWGETQPKEIYDWSTYQHCMGSANTLTKYCNYPNMGYNGYTDTLTILESVDDAATANWGNGWFTPTMPQWIEMYQNTTRIWMTKNGVNGCLFTASNGNSIFLPAAGNRIEDASNEVGSSGTYWSSWLGPEYPNTALDCFFDTDTCYVRLFNRSCGLTVRPVRSNSNPTSEVPEGAINGIFSVGVDEGINGHCNRLVYFSQGNLQYQASTNTWRFAENQWDYAYFDNLNISPTYDGWIDLFGWGTSGYDHGSSNYQPWSLGGDCYAYGDPSLNLNDQTGQADWGYNPIINGGNHEAQWRTLTQQEWEYVINDRNTVSGMRYALAEVAGISGLILLPDDWDASFFELSNVNMGGDFSNNVISEQQWQSLEQHGAVFFPTAGLRMNDPPEVGHFGLCGYYWSATAASAYTAFRMSSSNNVSVDSYVRILGHSVRLVQDAPNGSGSGNGGGGGHK